MTAHGSGALGVVVTATFSVGPLGEVLRWWGGCCGEWWDVRLGGYDQVMQGVWDEAGEMRTHDGVNVVVVRPADWGRDVGRGVELGRARELGVALELAAARSRARWVVVVTARDVVPTATELAVAAGLLEVAGRSVGVRVLTGWEVAASYAVERVYDEEGDCLGHVPHPAEFLAAMAGAVAREIRSFRARPVKVVAVDGDQTIWRGVLGEVGVHGVVVDAACAVLQDRLRAWRDRGVLLALVTKNDLADVEAVLRGHAGMRLRRSDWVAVCAGWQPKSEVLQGLAGGLDLGLDSIVFLDDNPVEVAEVRAHAPAVVSLQVPGGGLDGPMSERVMAHFLDHLWVMDGLGAPTAEDAARTAMYQEQADRKRARQASPTFEDFLNSLELEIDIVPSTAADVPRLAQLTQRTTQFNAMGKCCEADVMTRDLANGMIAMTVTARDRFGDYGLVGLIACRPVGRGLEVEHFLLSCRALGKRIEHQMIRALQDEANRWHAETIHLPVRSNGRNQPVVDFLQTHFAAHACSDGYLLPRRLSWQPIASALQPRALSAATPSPRLPPQVPADVWQAVATDWATAGGMLAAVRASRRRARPTHFPTPFRAPARGLEHSVAKRFSDVLGISPVGAEDNFFELGGQSVEAVQVLARLAVDHGYRVPLRTLFDHPTPATLATHLGSLGPDGPPATVPRLPRDGTAYALSPAQRRMWFFDRFAPGQTAYHIVTAHRVAGRTDVDRLRAWLDALARRHECLRARFPTVAGEPVQLFDGPGIALVEHAQPYPFCADPPTAVMAAPPTSFDLTTGPLARLDLWPMGMDDTLAVLTMHHIIADGWSVRLLSRELSSLASGRPLPTVDRQPLDLAAYQAELASGGARREAIAFWRATLRNAPASPVMPTDFPRPVDPSFSGAVVIDTLPAHLVASLGVLARARRTTLFSVLMAGFHALLYRWSGHDDILVGTPVSGRTHAESESMVGCLINTVVIRSRPESGQTFAGFLEVVRDGILDALAHQDLPIDEVVEALDLPRHRAHPPLFQIMLVLQEAGAEPLMLPGSTASATVAMHNGSAKFDLLLECMPDGDGHRLVLEYNTSLFRESTAQQFLTSFVHLLRHAAATPTASLGTLTLLSAAQKSSFLDGLTPHHPIVPPHATLHQWFEATAARLPQRTAVVGPDATLSYRTLDLRANQLAHRLRAAGAGPGRLVAVYLDRSTALVVAVLGVLKSGAAYMPIDPAYPAGRIQFILDDAGAAVVLSQRSLSNDLAAAGAPPDTILLMDDPSSEIDLQPTGPPASGAAADDLAYVIFTSGSTGQPKGCCVTHYNVTRLFSATAPWFHFSEDDVWTLFHSMAFDFSVWELWGALLHGGRVVVVPFLVSRAPEDFLELLIREKITVLNQTPSAFRQLIAAERAHDESMRGHLCLRLIIFGGEALEMAMLGPWFERHDATHPRLVNMYGITETTVHVTYRPVRADDVAGASLIGIPIPDLRAYILDPQLQLCPPGMPGELFIGGAGVARGYLNRDELTSQRFFASPFVDGDRLYRTGDVARLLPDHDIEYLGRMDRQVKIRGFRIELGEIESALLGHPAVSQAVVVARDDGAHGRRLVAYVTCHGDAGIKTFAPAPPVASLRTHLRRSLPDYMVPTAWVGVRQFPLTANGKLDTQALPPPEPVAAPPVAEAPATPTETALAAIWASVLRRDGIGRHDNFFAIGGDSILTIQVIGRARLAGWPLAPRHLFAHQTIAELAACAEILAAEGSAPAVPSRASETTPEVPLTPIQQWFASLPLDDPHWWNQALLLSLRQPIAEANFRDALTVVLTRHDAFRLRYARNPTSSGLPGPHQSLASDAGAPWLEVLPSNGPLPAAMARAHRALNLATGPVLGAVLTPDRLFLVAHHWAVDGVSWGIILDDVEAALSGRRAPPPTDSFATWARALAAQASRFTDERAYWNSLLLPHAPALPGDALASMADASGDVEEEVIVANLSLSSEETTVLLTQAPLRTRARPDEIMLAALVLALHDLTGHPSVRIHTESHGREEVISGVDVTRTVGWFTSLYPIEIVIPADADAADTLRATKDQRRATPHHGIGWGVLGLATASPAPPDLVFNYFGQLDSLVAGSALFALADEPTPAWHAPRNRRPHAVEIDASVRHGRYQAEIRIGRYRHRESTGQALADAFARRLREMIDLSDATAPSDFPLARLTRQQAAALASLEDVWPLSPMQRLQVAGASATGGRAMDQWAWQIRGPLDVERFQGAWALVLTRHPVLRATLCAMGHDPEWLAIPFSDQWAGAPWHVNDWRGMTSAERADAWRSLRVELERLRPDQSVAPLHRFSLVRLTADDYLFLWCAPDWMMDGWSCPIVLGDLAHAYADDRAARPPAVSFRDFLEWQARRDTREDETYWRATLAGHLSPTPLPVEFPAAAGGPRPSVHRRLPAAAWDAQVDLARQSGLTPNALLMAGWAAVLHGASRQTEVVFGAAFNGRPADLRGIDALVGPCTTNLPIRVAVDDTHSLASLAASVRDTIFAATEHQFVSPLDIQDWSAVPWRHRVFDSLIVFQNHGDDPSLVSLTPGVSMRPLDGPVHGRDTLTVVATPEPAGLNLRLVFESNRCSHARAHEILEMLSKILLGSLDRPLHMIDVPWSAAPVAVASGHRPPTHPRTPLERAMHGVWVRAFGPGVGVDDPFFEIGGHSLLAFRVLAALRSELGLTVTAADLFQYPTIATLAHRIESQRARSPGHTPTDTSLPASPAPDDPIKARAARFLQRLGRP